MHPLTDLVSFEEALARLVAGVSPTGRREEVALESCAGRILVEPVRANEDAPPGDRSRMDGYAVSTADLGATMPAMRKVQGRVLADASGLAPLQAGKCFEVATGALLPHGADAVVPVEETQRGPDEGTVRFLAAPRRGAHVSARGSDYRAGDVLAPAGVRMTAGRAAAAAAAGALRVSVAARPRVLIVPTGDEVTPAGQPLSAGHVRDSNSFGLAALITAQGGTPERHRVVADDPSKIEAALVEAATFDAAVFTGGTSAGVKDHLADALRGAGGVAFHGVRIRPGKPVLFGNSRGVPVLGLPGNPTSCILDAHLFLAPLVERLTGAPPAPRASLPAKLAGDIAPFVKASPGGFHTFVLVRVSQGRATPVFKDSMSVTGTSAADGYFEVAAGGAAPAEGDPVAVFMFD